MWVTFRVRVFCVLSENISQDGKRMYSRTQNENGTFNTRCLYCFMTVASAVENENDLARLEEHHVCPERALADLLAHSAEAEAHADRK